MRRVVAVMIVLLLFVATGCLGQWTTLMEEGFEEGLLEWQVGGDLPTDTETGESVEAYAVVVDTITRSGSGSLELGIDGRQDDGTIWIQRTILLASGKSELRVDFFLHSESESFNVIAQPVAYLGLTPPTCEADFTLLGNANRGEGWLLFSHSITISLEKGSELWVAVGITVAWETYMAYQIDDARVIAR